MCILYNKIKEDILKIKLNTSGLCRVLIFRVITMEEDLKKNQSENIIDGGGVVG